MATKWMLEITSGVHKKDGTFTGKKKDKHFYEGNFEEVVKQIEEEYFMPGDNIDDHGMCKLMIFEDDLKEIWTVVRETEEGEYRGIYRLYKYCD